MSQNREKMLTVKPFNKNSWNLEIQAKKVWQIFFLQDKKVQIIVFDYSKVTQCFLFLKVLSKTGNIVSPKMCTGHSNETY